MITKNVVVLFPPPSTANYNRVAVIKAIRTLTGMGLKEAKDLTEAAGWQDVRVNVGDSTRYEDGSFYPAADRYSDSITTLSGNGVHVRESPPKSILDKLRQLATDAIHSDEYDIAVDIIHIIKSHQK